MQINRCTTKSVLSRQTESILNRLNSIHNATQMEQINPSCKLFLITLISLPKEHQSVSVVGTFKSLPK